eukprot:m.779964 g.779964  ORF g.779964 m.779964 type:complete len:223 (+) comp23280_c1_seq2:393-1061(+)
METIVVRRKKIKNAFRSTKNTRITSKQKEVKERPFSKAKVPQVLKEQHSLDTTHAHVPPESAAALPFETDDADHAETPLNAYKDIVILLDVFARNINKTRTSLRIYDPYYCDGSVIEKLGSLGFKNVINRCEDFYANIEHGTVPDHDVLVTNPPYSADHMERILKFCATENGCKPWLVLMPHFVYTKNYYGKTLQCFFIVVGGMFCANILSSSNMCFCFCLI